jgi:hypothetical protein
MRHSILEVLTGQNLKSNIRKIFRNGTYARESISDHLYQVQIEMLYFEAPNILLQLKRGH